MGQDQQNRSLRCFSTEKKTTAKQSKDAKVFSDRREESAHRIDTL